MRRSQISSVPAERPDVLHELTGEPFRYPPLEPNSIRFLNLQPSPSDTDSLSCSFLHLPRSADTQYEVLSGFWEDPSSPFRHASLLVDGRSCRATPKLAQALCKFRHRDKSRLLWIQSLCVDPHNVSERNAQIGRLRDLLQSAQRLILWLGAAEDGSDAVFEHLSRFRHLVTEDNWPRPPLADPVYGRRREVLPYHPAAPAVEDYVRPYPGVAAAAFAQLCLRPWFYRPWSLPELALSKNILLVCGDHQLPQVPWYNPIAMLVEAYSADRQRQQTTPSHTSLFADLDTPVADAVSHVAGLSFHARSPLAWPGYGCGLGFENAYRIVRNCRANDRRDSVFATVALECVPTISIDYGSSVSETYRRATFALMRKHHSIQVLRRLDSPSRDSYLPSWALDFSTPLETNHALWVLPGARFLKDRNYHASIHGVEQADADQRTLFWPGDSAKVPQTRIDSAGRLVITGRFMEAIVATGPLMPANATGTNVNQITLEAWEHLASQLLQLPTKKRFPQSIVDAFLDTITANDTHDVLRNKPPRPLVSPVADRARRWYKRHGAGILRQVDPDYFAAASSFSRPPAGYGLLLPLDQTRKISSTREEEGEDKASQEKEELVVGRRIARACRNKRFFITDQGSMGLAPPGAKKGDAIAFLPTGMFPLFLQPRRDHHQNGDDDDNVEMTAYRLLGEGFLYDWWRHMEPVWDRRVRTGSYGDLLTEFVIE